MARYLAFCVTCEMREGGGKFYVAHVNDHGAVIAFENIPDDQQDWCKKEKPNIPGSHMYSFGGCPKCKRVGWPVGLKEVPFEGVLVNLFR